MYFDKEGFSSCTLAGSVAEAALHDLRVNRFTFDGFPEIHVGEPIDDIFTITLSWRESKDSNASFQLTMAEAKKAAKKFQSGKGHDEEIFPRVQAALVELERAKDNDI